MGGGISLFALLGIGFGILVVVVVVVAIVASARDK